MVGNDLNYAEESKKYNYDNYRWEYLGEAVGTEGNVFKNVHDLHDNNYLQNEVFRGLDFGFTNDPSAYVEWCYDAKAKVIYCHGEYVEKSVDNGTLAFSIKQINKHNFTIWLPFFH